MNLLVGCGTGISRLLRQMEEYKLPEPEFIDMEIAVRMHFSPLLNNVNMQKNVDYMMAKGLIDLLLDSIFDANWVGHRVEKLTERELKLMKFFRT